MEDGMVIRNRMRVYLFNNTRTNVFFGHFKEFSGKEVN